MYSNNRQEYLLDQSWRSDRLDRAGRWDTGQRSPVGHNSFHSTLCHIPHFFPSHTFSHSSLLLLAAAMFLDISQMSPKMERPTLSTPPLAVERDALRESNPNIRSVMSADNFSLIVAWMPSWLPWTYQLTQTW